MISCSHQHRPLIECDEVQSSFAAPGPESSSLRFVVLVNSSFLSGPSRTSRRREKPFFKHLQSFLTAVLSFPPAADYVASLEPEGRPAGCASPNVVYSRLASPSRRVYAFEGRRRVGRLPQPCWIIAASLGCAGGALLSLASSGLPERRSS